jgi:hypothetical protein
MTWTLRWKKQPTLYAILVRGLDLRQDYLGRKGSKDGQPKDDYELDQSVERGDVVRPTNGLTCVPEKTIPIPDLTLSYLRHVEYADTEADIVKDAIREFLVQLVDEGLFWGEAELGGVYRNLVLL